MRDLLKTSHPLLNQKLEEPHDRKQEGTHVSLYNFICHSLVSSDTEAYKLVDKMKTLEDLTSTVQEREGII